MNDTAQKTRWFPADKVNPARPGVYEIECDVAAHYAHWNGRRWGMRCAYVETAYDLRSDGAYGPVLRWRGLTKKPK